MVIRSGRGRLARAISHRKRRRRIKRKVKRRVKRAVYKKYKSSRRRGRGILDSIKKIAKHPAVQSLAKTAGSAALSYLNQ